MYHIHNNVIHYYIKLYFKKLLRAFFEFLKCGLQYLKKLFSIFSCHSNERLFLRDFVSCTGGTSGGRLARWLQPDSYVDIKCCEVLYAKDDLRAGWPSLVTIVTRDQYNEVVNAPGMKV